MIPMATHRLIKNEVELSAVTRPIDRLPPELLVYIFQWVQWLCGWSANETYRGDCARSWIALTWVCRQWRNIALSSPILWSYIDCRELPLDLECVTAFIERASGALLDVASDAGGDLESLLQVVLAPGNNLRSLALRVSSDGTSEKQLTSLLALLPDTMPTLRKLKLETFNEWLSDAWHDYKPDRTQFPALLDISFYSFHFPWDSLIYESLRILDLSSIRYPPSAARFLQILEACPQLESLTYDQYMSDRGLFTSMDASEQVVTLPRLRQLKFANTLHAVAYVYDRLCVPSSCSIITRFIVSDGALSSTGPIHAMLPRQRVFRNILSDVTSLRLTVDDQIVYLGFETQDGASFTDITGMIDDPQLDIPTLNSLLNLFAKAPLTTFRFYDPSNLHRVSAAMWITLFNRFPQLQHVDVGHTFQYIHDQKEGFSPLLEALQACRPEDGQLYAPGLQTLTVQTMIVDQPLAHALVSLVTLRALKGVPLKELVFKNSRCSRTVDLDAFMAQLKRHVEVSVVDISCCTGYHKTDTLYYVYEPVAMDEDYVEDEIDSVDLMDVDE
ncbi:hypothetical protein PYCCODRAFT_1479775 [Trametes coccinea BRFM310]|uniref:Uncharacterized protein n=1 Tax=Trametes coccinea (strain BRFM310) TaxID=1353009 RepID=A0A1Y2IIA0_TRAC3|nr:hypothetical protein PYCCODRAFT_1479775 [Trametes coccinea BRFM310]